MNLLPEEYHRIDTRSFINHFEDLLEDRAVRYKEQLWKVYRHQPAEKLQETETELRNVFLNPDLYAFIRERKETENDAILSRKLEILFREIKRIRLNADEDLNTSIAALREALAVPRVKVFGKTATLVQVRQFLKQHPDRRKRREAAEALRVALKDLNPPWKHLIDTRNRLAREAGYPDFTAFADDQLEYRHAIPFTAADTEKTFSGEAYDLLYELAGLNRSVNRMGFPPDRVQYVLHDLFDRMNLQVEKWLSQMIDAGPDFPSLCLPVEVPSDVRLLIGSGNSFDHLMQLAGEYGRACHYAHVSQDGYTLKSVPSVLLGISSGIICRLLLFSEAFAEMLDGENDTSSWMEDRLTWDNMQRRIFACLHEFESQLYQLPFERLDDFWNDLCVRYWGFNEAALPDWKIEEWFISRPMLATEYCLIEYYSNRIYRSKSESFTDADWGEQMKEDLYVAGNAKPWEECVIPFAGGAE